VEKRISQGDGVPLWQALLAFAEKQKAGFEKLLEDSHVDASLIPAITQGDTSPLKERATLIKESYVLNAQSEVKIKTLQDEIQHHLLKATEREEHSQALSVKIQLLEGRMEKSKKQVEQAAVSASPFCFIVVCLAVFVWNVF
jgi:hypothetical protein